MGDAPLILAIDVGSQSLRAALIGADGAFHHLVQRALEPPDVPHAGWAEKDPDYFHAQMGLACRQLATEYSAAMSRVRGVALTGQRASLVVLDASGRPARPAILWADRRRTRNLPPLGGVAGLGLGLAGVAGTIAELRAKAPVNWIATHQPDVWARADRILLLTSYLNYRLTGEVADSVACQVGYLPFDYRRLRWHRPGNWRWRALAGLRPAQMARLVAPGAVLGEITAEASEHTGVPVGTPVFAAAADKACEVLGSGCLTPSQACLSFGTAATVNVPGTRYVEVHRFAPPYPGAIPGTYSTEVQVYRGFWLVSWFMREFGSPERGRARAAGVAPETLLDELLQACPPGADGLLAQPYWSPGLKDPGPEARGALIGFTDAHTRAHVYRALVEGLMFALREGLERIEKRGGRGVSALRVAGGGSQSDAIMQISADVFGRPATRPRHPEATSLGAAVCAAVGLGVYDSFEAGVGGMCHTGTEFEPTPASSALYERIYRRVNRPMYRRLRPLYAAIRATQGDRA